MWKSPFFCGNLLTFARLYKILRTMKKNIVPIMLLTVAVCLFVSCIGSDDDDDKHTYYGDTAVTGFSLGTLNRYLKTKAKDGVTDSIYKRTYAGSNYAFYIDQVNCKIYNVDSLPYGTDSKKVLTTVTTKNGGTPYYKSMYSDSLFTYSSSDSVDFSVPRQLVVANYTGSKSVSRTYEVTLNVHQEPADTFFWSKMPAGTKVPTVEKVQGSSVNTYKVEGGQLLKSADNGSTWTVETLDDDASLLPTANVNFTCKTVSGGIPAEYVLLTGTSDANSKYAVNWFKYEGNGDYKPEEIWAYISVDEENLYPLPKLSNLKVVRFDDSILLAIGGAGLDDSKAKAYSAIYVSHDNGISWIPNDVFRIPEGLDTSATDVDMLVDNDKFVWLVCSGTGEIWRGRLSQYSKEKVSKGVLQ